MDKIVYIYEKKDKDKFLDNFHLLYSLSKKNRLELICIIHKSFRNIAIKLKENHNVRFYLINNKKDINKIKIYGKKIIIYNEINFNIKNINDILKNIEKNKILIVKNKFINKKIINKYIIGKEEEKLNYNFLIEYYRYNKKYFLDNYNFKFNIIKLININIFIYIKKILKLIEKILSRKFISDYIHEKTGLLSYKFLSLVTTIVLVRLLTVSYYGEYITIYNFLLIVSGFIGSSNIILTKSLVESNNKSYIEIDIIVKILFTMIAGMIIIILLPYISKYVFYSYNLYSIFLIFLAAIFLSLEGLGISILYSYLNFKDSKYITIIEGLSKFILIISLTIIYKNYGFIIGLPIAFFLTDLYILYYFRRTKVKINIDIYEIIKNSGNKIKGYLKNILYISLPPLLFNLYTSFDIQILRIFTSFQDVGYFYNAILIVSTLSNILSISSISLPRILRWKKEEISRNIPKLIIAQLIINIIIYFTLFLTGKYIIILLYGKGYLLSAELIKYLGIIFIIQSFNIFSLILYKAGLEKYYGIYTVSVSLLSIVYDLLLIPRFRLDGAIAAAILSNLTNILIAFYIYKTKYDNITPRPVY
ncbi:polysaccharide biosynthesis protein [Nanobdella aerobiophila]|uniref:Polysaccharide biosynthesis protein n=1 Tax=Nanobdella aerobiophila TaxID=2586965 RepID=A0A915SIF3_9ARCH|nr:hypothetical protein [Nanobdella aerobiophila]BBL45602.1 polysaccharide biosynthesis protein [Nanobdella aerobiophila]